MVFLFKKSKIVLDVFTYDEMAYTYFPVDYANKFIPEWWKNLPKQKKDTGFAKGNNMRNCSGIIDYYSKQSFIIPLWCSFVFSPGYNGNSSQLIPNNDKKNFIEGQNKSMRGNHYLRNFEQFKIHCPWYCKEKSGVNFLAMQSFYNFNEPDSFIIAPGIINFKYQHTASIHFFTKPNSEEKQSTIEFEAVQPMLHFTAISEKQLELRNHLVDEKEFNKIEDKRVFFTNNYNKVKKIRKENEKKCPFGFD